MTDQELLELAAKAAGYAGWKHCEPIPGEPALYIQDAGGVWMPLFDDGDAQRLAVKLRLWVQVNHMSVEVECWQDDTGETRTVTEPADPLCDYSAATRRAIVRAAAEVGKGMES